MMGQYNCSCVNLSASQPSMHSLNQFLDLGNGFCSFLNFFQTKLISTPALI